MFDVPTKTPSVFSTAWGETWSGMGAGRGGDRVSGKVEGRRGVGGGVLRVALWLVEWMAVVLGLLPCGGRGGNWPIHKSLIAFAAAIITPVATALYLAVGTYQMTGSSTQYIDSNISTFIISNYVITNLGSFIILLGVWVKRRDFTDLLASLRSLLRECQSYSLLPYLLKTLFIIPELLLTCVLTVHWGTSVIYNVPGSMMYFKIAVAHAAISVPFLYSLALVVYVLSGHLLLVSLRDTNTSLEMELPRGTGGQPQESLLLPLRRLRQRYAYLHRLHHQMDSVLSLPTLTINMRRLLQVLAYLGYVLTNAPYLVPVELWAIVFYLVFTVVAIYTHGSVADCLQDEGTAPLRTLAEVTTNESWVVEPEVEAEILRLVKLSEQPLITRPAGLFTLGRSNLLPMATAVTTYLVVLLQFHFQPHPKEPVILSNLTDCSVCPLTSAAPLE